MNRLLVVFMVVVAACEGEVQVNGIPDSIRLVPCFGEPKTDAGVGDSGDTGRD